MPPFQHFLPNQPAAWYLFCSSRDVRNTPVARELLGRRLVAYRTSRGDVAVLDAQCCHLGADLGRGRVAGEYLECPFHGWQYGPDGRCAVIPGAAVVPEAARQRSYPVAERGGMVYFFNDRNPRFPLPFFEGQHPGNFLASRPVVWQAACPWYMVAANGFDMQHLSPVHGRQLLCEPRVDAPAELACRIRYETRVTGSTVYDRLIRLLAGETVRVSITNWGGTLILVTATFQRAESRLLFSLEPVTPRTSVVRMVVFLRRREGLDRLAAPAALWVRRQFSRAFVAGDFRQLAGIDYSPANLIEADRTLRSFVDWLAALPSDGKTVRPDGIAQAHADREVLE